MRLRSDKNTASESSTPRIEFLVSQLEPAHDHAIVLLSTEPRLCQGKQKRHKLPFPRETMKKRGPGTENMVSSLRCSSVLESGKQIVSSAPYYVKLQVPPRRCQY